MVIGKGACDRALSESEVRKLMSEAFYGAGLTANVCWSSSRTAREPRRFR